MASTFLTQFFAERMVVGMKTRGGVLLKAWRDERGFDQMKAAVELGLHVSIISRLENGSGGLSLAKAAVLNDRVGIPMRAWLEPAEEERP